MADELKQLNDRTILNTYLSWESEWNQFKHGEEKAVWTYRDYGDGLPATGKTGAYVLSCPLLITEVINHQITLTRLSYSRTTEFERLSKSGPLRHFDFVERWINGLGTVVPKKDVYFTGGVEFNGQNPISRGGKTTGRGAFKMQSAETISAAYDFNLAARDFMFADGAIESVVEAIPWSALIDPSQSSELIFCGQSYRLRGRRHV